MMLLANTFFAQTKKTVTAYTSLYNKVSIISNMKICDCTERYEATKTIQIGVSYTKQLNKWLSVNSGVEYSSFNIAKTTTSIYDVLRYGREIPHYSYGKITLITLPINLRADFLKYFFVNTGPFVDFEMNNTIIGKQTGIGVKNSIGASYAFKNHFSILLNPFIQIHSLLSFGNKNNSNDKLVNSGLNLGISYQIK